MPLKFAQTALEMSKARAKSLLLMRRGMSLPNNPVRRRNMFVKMLQAQRLGKSQGVRDIRHKAWGHAMARRRGAYLAAQQEILMGSVHVIPPTSFC